MFGIGAKKKAENTCAALRDHIASVINQINGDGVDSLLLVPELSANKSESKIIWWVGEFQVFCGESHIEGVKQIMLAGVNQFNGLYIYAYSNSTDTSTWKMQLSNKPTDKPTKIAKLMYETYAKHYKIQDLMGYLQ